MKKLHLIKDKAIRTQIDCGYLPAKNFIEYLLNNVKDFKNIKLNKKIDAKFFGYNFEYELI